MACTAHTTSITQIRCSNVSPHFGLLLPEQHEMRLDIVRALLVRLHVLLSSRQAEENGSARLTFHLRRQ